jgi:hypothetical protein
MSKPRLLLAASLICNAILLAWTVLPGTPSGDAASPAAQSVEPAPSRLAAWFAEPPAPAKAAPSGYSEEGWTRSLHDDVAELRARGVDDATVRTLALAETERLYRERAQAVFGPRQRLEYWEARRRSGRIDAGQLATFQRLRREAAAAIAELAGPDAVSSERNTPNTFMGAQLMTLHYLPTDKRLALQEYLETSEAEMQASNHPLARLRRGGAGLTPTSHAEQELARDAQIRLILGPEGYETYLRRSSQTAMRLRWELTAFKPTRAEFDALVALKHEHQLQSMQVGASSSRGTTPQKARMMTEQQTASVRAALGEQRYADYERARDRSVMLLDGLISELQVGPEAARASFEQLEQARTKWRSFMAEAQDPRRHEEIQKNLSAVQRQLRTDLARTLGLDGLSENDVNVLLADVEAFPQFWGSAAHE